VGKITSDWKPSDEMDKNLAFGLIKDLSKFGHVMEDLASFIDVSRSTNGAGEKFPRERWQALANLFYHPWFRRLWTYQEVVVSSRATVLGLFGSIGWHELGMAAETIHIYSDKDIELVLEVSHSQSIQELPSWVTYCEGAMIMPRFLAERLYDTQKKRLSTMSIVDICKQLDAICVLILEIEFLQFMAFQMMPPASAFPQILRKQYHKCTLNVRGRSSRPRAHCHFCV
jgi:hypothetical protein